MDNLGTGPGTDVYYANASQCALIDQRSHTPVFESNLAFICMPRAEVRGGAEEMRLVMKVLIVLGHRRSGTG